MVQLSPTSEAERYNSATAKKPLIETKKTALPVSTIGRQARKRALRECRCFPARIAREKEEAKAKEKEVAERQAKQAADAEKHDADKDKADAAYEAERVKTETAAAGGEGGGDSVPD